VLGPQLFAPSCSSHTAGDAAVLAVTFSTSPPPSLPPAYYFCQAWDQRAPPCPSNAPMSGCSCQSQASSVRLGSQPTSDRHYFARSSYGWLGLDRGLVDADGKHRARAVFAGVVGLVCAKYTVHPGLWMARNSTRGDQVVTEPANVSESRCSLVKGNRFCQKSFLNRRPSLLGIVDNKL
jgi:hypothetical protein